MSSEVTELPLNPDEAGNFEDMEKQFAVKGQSTQFTGPIVAYSGKV